MLHARGMSRIARETGLSRERLYKALNVEGNPEFGTVMRVIKALGLRLTASRQNDGPEHSASKAACSAA